MPLVYSQEGMGSGVPPKTYWKKWESYQDPQVAAMLFGWFYVTKKPPSKAWHRPGGLGTDLYGQSSELQKIFSAFVGDPHGSIRLPRPLEQRLLPTVEARSVVPILRPSKAVVFGIPALLSFFEYMIGKP